MLTYHNILHVTNVYIKTYTLSIIMLLKIIVIKRCHTNIVKFNLKYFILITKYDYFLFMLFYAFIIKVLKNNNL